MRRIKKLRKKDVAEMAGISEGWLSLILSGAKPSWETSKTLARITKSDPVRWMEQDVHYMNDNINKIIYEIIQDTPEAPHEGNTAKQA